MYIANFYSHASYEARHGVKDRRAEVADFYSHASYEARRRPGRPVQRQIHFYSHASYEARLIPDFSVRAERKFLLTRLLRGATIWDIKRCPKTLISTHTPLTRRDDAKIQIAREQIDFYSHASYEARLEDLVISHLENISTHTPLTRRDGSRAEREEIGGISTHTPLTRRDIMTTAGVDFLKNFYSHASYEARQAIFDENTHLSNFYSHASYEARRL